MGHSRIDQQLGDLSDAPDVLQPVLRAESQVVVDPGPDVVPVQHLAEEPAEKQFFFQVGCQGGLART